jgi:hypothetical protein
MRTSFHHQPEAQHPNFQLSTSWQADYPIFRGRSGHGLSTAWGQLMTDCDIGARHDHVTGGARLNFSLFCIRDRIRPSQHLKSWA